MRWYSGEIPRSTVAVGGYGRRDRVSRRVESGRRRKPRRCHITTAKKRLLPAHR